MSTFDETCAPAFLVCSPQQHPCSSLRPPLPCTSPHWHHSLALLSTTSHHRCPLVSTRTGRVAPQQQNRRSSGSKRTKGLFSLTATCPLRPTRDADRFCFHSGTQADRTVPTQKLLVTWRRERECRRVSHWPLPVGPGHATYHCHSQAAPVWSPGLWQGVPPAVAAPCATAGLGTCTPALPVSRHQITRQCHPRHTLWARAPCGDLTHPPNLVPFSPFHLQGPTQPVHPRPPTRSPMSPASPDTLSVHPVKSI